MVDARITDPTEIVETFRPISRGRRSRYVIANAHPKNRAKALVSVENKTRTFSAPIDLPNDHPIYRAFFEFDDGPPTTSHELNGWGDNLVHKHLKAVMRGDRVGVLYSNKDYSSEWGYHPENKRFLAVDNTKFAVNVIVYALTR